MTTLELNYLAAEIARRTEPVLSIGKLSEETGMTPDAIRKSCQRGELPYHRMGRRLMFYRSEINEKIRDGHVYDMPVRSK